MKRIYYGADARNRLFKGIEEAYDAVSVSYGPLGGDALIGNKYGPPTFTHDGDTIASAIYDLPDDESTYGRNEGIELNRAAADKLNKAVGDATTTVTALNYHLVKEANVYLDSGVNPQRLKTMVQTAGKEALEILSSMGELIDTSSNRGTEVATISAKDSVIGKLVGDVFKKVGKDGYVSVVEGRGVKTEVEYIDGFKIDKGYYSSLFVNDEKNDRAVLDNVSVVLIEDKVEDIERLKTFIGKLLEDGRESILFVADELENDVLGELVAYKLGGAHIAAVKPPSFGEKRTDKMQDLAILTGGKVISSKHGLKLEDAAASDVGVVKSAIVTKDGATLIGGLPIKKRVGELKKQVIGKSDADVEVLQDRIASLNGAAAVITVGGDSVNEIEKLHFDIDDAVSATKAALAEGIVPGGGVTLVDVSRKLKGYDEGYEVVKKALIAPFFKLMENAGIEVDIDTVGNGVGVDVMSGSDMLVDMKSIGVIDPVKATRMALSSAISIASSTIGMGVLVVDIPDKE